MVTEKEMVHNYHNDYLVHDHLKFAKKLLDGTENIQLEIEVFLMIMKEPCSVMQNKPAIGTHMSVNRIRFLLWCEKYDYLLR